jgi:hypothetical protein
LSWVPRFLNEVPKYAGHKNIAESNFIAS